jgi:hypothetical protein
MQRTATLPERRFRVTPRVPGELRGRPSASPGLTFADQLLSPVGDSHARWRGARLLMIGVLQDAVADWFRYRDAHTTRGRRLLREIEEWFSSPDRRWLYSFESICLHLDLDPESVRRGLNCHRSTQAR